MAPESSDERVYPVRDIETIGRMQADYSAKIDRNREAGRKAFASGDYKPFKGFPVEQWKNLFGIGFELDEASQQAVIDRVSRPMKKLADQYGVPSIFAGIGDLPPHVTLDVGTFKDIPSDKVYLIDDWLLSNKSHLQWLSNILRGLTFHMDTIVVAPNSYICAGKFDDEQGAPYRARMAIEKMMQRSFQNLEKVIGAPLTGSFAPPYRYDDILHTSVSRVTEKAPSSALLRYANEVYASIGADLMREPIPVTVASVTNGRAADFIASIKPELLLK